MPHLRRTADLRARMTELAGRQWAIDLLAYPVIFSGAGGRLRFANRAGEALLRKGAGLRVVDGRIRAEVPSDDERLQHMLSASGKRRVNDLRPSGYGGWLRILQPSRHSDLSLFIVRPPRSMGRYPGIGDGGSGFLIFVAEQRVDSISLAARLRTLWQLTASEANLAVQLMEGGNLTSVAERIGISRETAKSHLAAIFSKANVQRQSQLLQKLASLAILYDPADRHDPLS